jgi:hypothetical protein
VFFANRNRLDMHGCFLLNRTSVLLLWIPFSETPVGEADTFPYRSKAFVIGYGLGCGRRAEAEVLESVSALVVASL